MKYFLFFGFCLFFPTFLYTLIQVIRNKLRPPNPSAPFAGCIIRLNDHRLIVVDHDATTITLEKTK